jgi:hypothetical protein
MLGWHFAMFDRTDTGSLSSPESQTLDPKPNMGHIDAVCGCESRSVFWTWNPCCQIRYAFAFAFRLFATPHTETLQTCRSIMKRQVVPS